MFPCIVSREETCLFYNVAICTCKCCGLHMPRGCYGVNSSVSQEQGCCCSENQKPLWAIGATPQVNKNSKKQINIE